MRLDRLRHYDIPTCLTNGHSGLNPSDKLPVKCVEWFHCRSLLYYSYKCGVFVQQCNCKTTVSLSLFTSLSIPLSTTVNSTLHLALSSICFLQPLSPPSSLPSCPYHSHFLLSFLFFPFSLLGEPSDWGNGLGSSSLLGAPHMGSCRGPHLTPRTPGRTETTVPPHRKQRPNPSSALPQHYQWTPNGGPGRQADDAIVLSGPGLTPLGVVPAPCDTDLSRTGCHAILHLVDSNGPVRRGDPANRQSRPDPPSRRSTRTACGIALRRRCGIGDRVGRSIEDRVGRGIEDRGRRGIEDRI